MRFPFPRAFASVAIAGVLLASTVGHALADVRNFSLMNNTGALVANLYVSPTDTVDWGDDILGKDVLANGESVAITFGRFDAGKCLYDVKIILKDGTEAKIIGVDLCTIELV